MTPRLQGYRKLFEDVRQGRLRAVYFMHGPEEYMKREFLREVIEAALPQGDRTFNLDIIHGDEFDPQGFSERLRAFPMFAARRVVVLRNFEALSPSERDRVAESAESVPEGLTLVVESSSPKLETTAHKRMAAVAGRHGGALAFDVLDEAESLERLLGRFRREEVEVDADALDLLIDSVGTRLIDLANEVEKILLAVAPGERVTRDVVASVVGRYRTDSLFAVLDGVGSSSPTEILPRVARLIESGEEPVFIVAMLLRRVVSLLEVQTLVAERGRAVASDRALAAALAATQSPFYAGKLRAQAAGASRGELEALLANLRWADAKLKTTALDARCVVEEAVLASHLGKTLAAPSVSA